MMVLIILEGQCFPQNILVVPFITQYSSCCSRAQLVNKGDIYTPILMELEER